MVFEPSAAPAHVDGPSPAGMISGLIDVEDSVRPLSVFDMFRIGVGPSSSHTVGPMRAAQAFAQELYERDLRPQVVRAELFGSLGATGRGHSTDRAVLLGLEGYMPDTVPGEVVTSISQRVESTGVVSLLGGWCEARMEPIVMTPFTVLPYHCLLYTSPSPRDDTMYLV